MLEIFQRKVRGVVTVIILSLIVIAFAFFGIGDYFSSRTTQGVAAIVDGKKISWETVDAVYHRLHRHFGANANERAMKEQLRMALVQRLALLSHAKSLGFQISDIQLGEALVQLPAFQADGQFSKDRYLEVLQQVGYKDAEFRQELAQDLLIAQLEQGLIQSNFSLQPELSRLISLLDQKRDFGYAILSAKGYEKDIVLPKEDIQAYYDSHLTQFLLPEKVSVDYIQLSVEDLAKTIEVNDDILKEYYKEHIVLYTSPESIHARHILITVPDKSNSESAAKAKEKSEQILAALKNGEDFEKLAKENSQDEGSAKKGGDLGWFTRGQMVQSFEQAAFNLKEPNEISDLIETQFGYHIIQLVEKKDKTERPFEEVKNLIGEQYQREKALALYTDKIEQMSKLSYEYSNDLLQVAENLNLPIQTTDLFTRQGGSDLTKHPEFINAAFGNAVLTEKHNSDPIKIDDFTTIVLRLKEHQPPLQQTLEQSEPKIIALLKEERAIAKVKETSEAIVKQLQENPGSLQSLIKENNLKWVEKTGIARNTEMDQAILSSVFQAKYPSENKPSIERLALPSGDAAIIAVTQVNLGNLDSIDNETQLGYKKGLSEIFSQIEFTLYANKVYKAVKAQFPERVASSSSNSNPND